jgi:hypothetical protein
VEEEEPTGYVRYEKFEPVMMNILMQKKLVLLVHILYLYSTGMLHIAYTYIHIHFVCFQEV